MPLAANNNVDAAIVVKDPYVIGGNIIIEGYYGANVNLALTDDNATEVIPVIALNRDWFTADEQSATLFQTDGITTEYSGDLWTSVSHSYDAVTGIYYTLMRADEHLFSQEVVKQPVTVYTYSLMDTIDYTINETMKDINSAYTDANFTCSKMYTSLTFDKALMDAFYLAVQQEENFGIVSTDYPAVTQQVINLIDDVFSPRIIDIIYSPYNSTDMIAADATWTIADEVKAVMGGNETDTSINGTARNVRLRNALFGYIGWNIAPETVIGAALKATFPEGLIYGFEATPTTYTVKLNIKPDFAASPVGLGLGFLLSIIQPSDIAELKASLFVYWLEASLITVAAFVVVAGGTRYFTRKKSNTKSLSLIIGLIAALFTFVIYVLLTIVVI